MMRLLLKFLAVGVGLQMLCSPILAHHGSSIPYNLKQPLTLKGTVTEFVWSNPHVQLYFDVKDDKGAVTHWGGEANAPRVVLKAGLTKTALKTGDQVTVTVFPAKAGTKFGLLANILLPSGQLITLISPEDAAERSGYSKDAP